MITLDFTPAEIEKCRDRILSALSLSRKAGKCVTGTDMCTENVRNNTAKLVIYANDLSDNTLKRIKDSTSYHKVQTIMLNVTKDELGARLGKTSGVSCAAILDEGFVKIIEKIYAEIHTESTEVQQ